LVCVPAPTLAPSIAEVKLVDEIVLFVKLPVPMALESESVTPNAKPSR